MALATGVIGVVAALLIALHLVVVVVYALLVGLVAHRPDDSAHGCTAGHSDDSAEIGATRSVGDTANGRPYDAAQCGAGICTGSGVGITAAQEYCAGCQINDSLFHSYMCILFKIAKIYNNCETCNDKSLLIGGGFPISPPQDRRAHRRMSDNEKNMFQNKYSGSTRRS